MTQLMMLTTSRKLWNHVKRQDWKELTKKHTYLKTALVVWKRLQSENQWDTVIKSGKKAPMPTGGLSGRKVLENLCPDWTCYYYCMVCSFNGTSKNILEEHMKIHLGEIQKEA